MPIPLMAADLDRPIAEALREQMVHLEGPDWWLVGDRYGTGSRYERNYLMSVGVPRAHIWTLGELRSLLGPVATLGEVLAVVGADGD